MYLFWHLHTIRESHPEQMGQQDGINSDLQDIYWSCSTWHWNKNRAFLDSARWLIQLGFSTFSYCIVIREVRVAQIILHWSRSQLTLKSNSIPVINVWNFWYSRATSLQPIVHLSYIYRYLPLKESQRHSSFMLCYTFQNLCSHSKVTSFSAFITSWKKECD